MSTIIQTGEAPGAKSRRKLADMLYAQGTGNEPMSLTMACKRSEAKWTK
jgi:hypothetical protein